MVSNGNLLFLTWAIKQSKACLGTVVHKKTAAVIAFTEVKSEDQWELANVVLAAKTNLCVPELLLCL